MTKALSSSYLSHKKYGIGTYYNVGEEPRFVGHKVCCTLVWRDKRQSHKDFKEEKVLPLDS